MVIGLEKEKEPQNLGNNIFTPRNHHGCEEKNE